MRPNAYFFLIISCLYCTVPLAQTVDDVVRFADSKFEQGDYIAASKEYNRAYFFAYGQNDRLLYRIAECYFHTQQYEQAGDFFDRAYRLSQNDSLKNNAVLGKAYSLLMDGEFVLCLGELMNLSDVAGQKQLQQYHLIKGIAHFQLMQDELSEVEFRQYMAIADAPDYLLLSLENEFHNVKRYPKRYNPQRAYVMSAIIPGSGQMMSGEIKEGINSMLLIGGLYLVALRVMSLYSFWDGAIALLPWVQRYYFGGMDSSKEIAKTKINRKRYQTYNQIIDILNTANEP
jgi:tetratricopeptide (TPR) repeat protein